MDVDYVNNETLRDLEICLLVSQVGGDGKRYQRGKKSGIKKLVSEIYSPPRVTGALKHMP